MELFRVCVLLFCCFHCREYRTGALSTNQSFIVYMTWYIYLYLRRLLRKVTRMCFSWHFLTLDSRYRYRFISLNMTPTSWHRTLIDTVPRTSAVSLDSAYHQHHAILSLPSIARPPYPAINCPTSFPCHPLPDTLFRSGQGAPHHHHTLWLRFRQIRPLMLLCTCGRWLANNCNEWSFFTIALNLARMFS